MSKATRACELHNPLFPSGKKKYKFTYGKCEKISFDEIKVTATWNVAVTFFFLL